MKVYIQGGKPSEINLDDKCFLAEGGEGKVFIKGKTVYKIYLDPSKMISLSKISELQLLDQPNILNPKNVLLDVKGVPIGYTMEAIINSVPLCKLFTNDFRARFQIDNIIATNLVKSIQKGIEYVHSKDCVMVDGNEMNYLVDNKFTIPYFIDVDSWQTKSFPASAIMMSIRDFHAKGFSELTDWFSFAVIATQMFIGIHPYKGIHPGFKKYDMEGRMKANASIFNSDVRLPAGVRPLDSIPANYKEWLIRVLEKGERLLPPSESGAISMMVINKDIIGATQFSIEFIQDYIKDIIRYNNGFVTVHGCIHRNKDAWPVSRDSVEMILSPVSLSEVMIDITEGLLLVGNKKSGPIKSIAAEEKMIVGNAIFVKNEDKLTEVVIEEFGDKIMPVPKSIWSVMPNSTKIFNGLVYQNILGTPWIMIPYEIGGKRAMYQQMIPELKGYNVLEAKYENHVANVITEKNGIYYSFMFKFNDTMTKYIYFLELDVVFHSPNFIVLENGICIRITIDDEVHIFSNRIDKQDCKVLKDKSVTFDMKLCHNKMDVMLRLGSKLYKFKVKKI